MKIYNLIIALFFVVFWSSCEKEFIPELSTDPNDIVVEGYIEASDKFSPPYVILTHNIPFYDTLGIEQLNDLFVHDADVKINDGTKTVALTELCWNDIPDSLKASAGQFFGLEADSVNINFCVYVDLTGQLKGEIGKTYQLSILAEGKTITATTSIPPHVPIDSLEFTPPPGLANDSLARCLAYVSDQPNVKNYYRYFESFNGGPFIKNRSSVTNDDFFDGQTFKFNLVSPVQDNQEIDPATIGLYKRGDALTIKWCTIDKATFDFYRTSEFNRQNQGPFSNYTRILSNINGGLGVFGGYSVTYYNLIVPPL